MKTPVGKYGPEIQEYTHISLSAFHIIYAAIYPNLGSSGICPHPENVNEEYFGWSRYVVSCVLLIWVFGFCRLLAFRTLGKNFTFQLARPTHLVTTGIYAYVQHPSYLPYLVLHVTSLALFARVDGPMGCFLPSSWVATLSRYHTASVLLQIVVTVIGLWARVRDEEEMLKGAFGKEWVEWHNKTKRFIPGVV
jgi:protein-S-isoprenylcysteine O-methyltransferase Ste14